ncbi:MAG: flagellar assembly protein FliW [Jatrophihabitans sp.]|uniref:flagellar assembly protein FliW n=1 Tax=Jatrophihabitans sp. TaxID=1932789 RepID=UPI003F80D9C7
MSAMLAPVAPVKQSRHITMVEPIPGFPGLRDFDLTAIDDEGVLFSLRSADDPALRFILTPAGTFFPDYRPELPSSLETQVGETVDLLLVLTVERGLADATANLRAPVVLGSGTDRAVQLVLDDDALPMRQPLLTR